MCTGESPENATVTILCTESDDVVFASTYLVENTLTPMNITGSVPVPLNQQCKITVVFSNEAGISEPFILPFGKLCVKTLFIIDNPSHYCPIHEVTKYMYHLALLSLIYL